MLFRFSIFSSYKCVDIYNICFFFIRMTTTFGVKSVLQRKNVIYMLVSRFLQQCKIKDGFDSETLLLSTYCGLSKILNDQIS